MTIAICLLKANKMECYSWTITYALKSGCNNERNKGGKEGTWERKGNEEKV